MVAAAARKAKLDSSSLSSREKYAEALRVLGTVREEQVAPEDLPRILEWTNNFGGACERVSLVPNVLP